MPASDHSSPQALILDRDGAHTRALRAALESAGYSVVVSDQRIDQGLTPDVAFIDLHLPGCDVLKMLANPALEGAMEVILMADKDDPAQVRRGISYGATYFFCKPFDPEFIEPLLADLVAESASGAAQARAPNTRPLDQFGLLRGSSPPMRKLYRVLRKVAPTDTSVLLIGESGTGKELVAHTLHQMSDVASGPFVAMNCAAVPKDLFESELFGHERGSFSGAERQHKGFFERAAGGTLFLDELTEMPIELQVKLLRVLESGAFRRVGGERDLATSVRIIAATNRDPAEAIESGELRDDLYYRIARFPIRLPPLRKRTSDILGLAVHFLNELNDANEAAIGISQAALDAIERHSWPGNVRELRSAIERAFILADGKIGAEHLPDLREQPAGDQLRISVGESIDDTEKKLIFATLEANGGDKKATAESLGVSLKTLYNRLNQYAAEDEART